MDVMISGRKTIPSDWSCRRSNVSLVVSVVMVVEVEGFSDSGDSISVLGVWSVVDRSKGQTAIYSESVAQQRISQYRITIQCTYFEVIYFKLPNLSDTHKHTLILHLKVWKCQLCVRVESRFKPRNHSHSAVSKTKTHGMACRWRSLWMCAGYFGFCWRRCMCIGLHPLSPNLVCDM